MSRTIEKLPDGTIHEEVIDLEQCRWMYDDCCCYHLSDFVADYPNEADCGRCQYFEKEDGAK